MSRPSDTGYSAAEELANSITHGVGALLSAVGGAVLVVASLRHGTAVHLVSSLVFGGTLLALYVSSTLYHAVGNPGAKRLLRRVDHAAIFLLIAGTYTPFALVTLRGPWGWSILGIEWALAVIGLCFEGALRRRRAGLSLGLYILMGWVAVAAIKPLLAALPLAGVALLFAGGLCYTVGAVFYVRRSMPFSHALWHGAVLAGSLLHYFAVLRHVIPRG